MTNRFDTEKGWPRPIVDSWPVPWGSHGTNIGELDDGRYFEAFTERLCQVCGLGFEDSATVFIFVAASPDEEPPKDVMVQAMDNGLLHDRCMRLARGRCPRLRTLDAKHLLTVVRGRIEDVVQGRLEAGLILEATEGETPFLREWEKA